MAHIKFPAKTAFNLNKFFAGIDSIYLYLHGVNIIVHPNHIMLQATNNEVLMIVKHDIQNSVSTPESYIISSDVIKKFHVNNTRSDFYAILDTETKTVTHNGEIYNDALVKGIFPKTSSAIPINKQTFPNWDIPLNTFSLDKFNKFVTAELGKFAKAYIGLNGDICDPQRVYIWENYNHDYVANYLGVIMPARETPEVATDVVKLAEKTIHYLHNSDSYKP